MKCPSRSKHVSAWAPAVIRLPVAVPSGVDVILIWESKTLHEQLDIDKMQGLTNKASGTKKTTETETTASGTAETLGPINVRRGAVTMAVTQRVADIETEDEKG